MNKGLLMSIQGAVQMLGCLAYVPLTSFTGVPFSMVIGAILFMSALIFPILPSVIASVVIGCFIVLGNTLCGCGCPVLIKHVAPASHRGKLNGLFVSAGKGFALVMPMVNGPLLDAFWLAPFFVMGGLATVGLACALVAVKGVKKLDKSRSVAASEQTLLEEKTAKQIEEKMQKV